MADEEVLGFPGRTARAWALLLLWTGAVWWLGGDGGAAPVTSRILSPLLAWLLPWAAPDSLSAAIVAIRKSAHLAVYGVLALLALRALGSAPALRGARAALGAMLWVATVAAFDELRQAGSPVRTGSAGDVALDLAGGALALACASTLARARAAAGGAR